MAKNLKTPSSSIEKSKMSGNVPHQQIPYFGTVPTVITIIVQYLTALTAYVSTGSQFHGNPALTQPDTVRVT